MLAQLEKAGDYLMQNPFLQKLFRSEIAESIGFVVYIDLN